MLHHIQKSILDRLATAQSHRYGALKPDNLDGNVFGYHLKQLMSEKLIMKADDGSYELTRAGKEYIVTRYEDPLTSAHSILLFVIKRGDTYLMRTRKVQPLIGWTGFPHGEPVANLPLDEKAINRLAEKTSIRCTLSVRLNALITQTVDGELQSYSHAIVLYGETDQELQIIEDETGRNTWMSRDTLSADHILPSCRDIINCLDKGITWAELTYELQLPQ